MVAAIQRRRQIDDMVRSFGRVIDHRSLEPLAWKVTERREARTRCLGPRSRTRQPDSRNGFTTSGEGVTSVEVTD
jgi:hypothetical protein